MPVFDPSQLRLMRQAAERRPEPVAVAVDRSVATVTNWERGTVTPNAEQIAALADLYGCTVADFYVDEVPA